MASYPCLHLLTAGFSLGLSWSSLEAALHAADVGMGAY